MSNFISEMKGAVESAEQRLKESLPFENTLIYYCLERRNRGESLDSSDHICAMIYSLLSSSRRWINCRICPKTGTVKELDAAFDGYEPRYLKDCTAEELLKKFESAELLPRFKNKQTKAISHNIKKLLSFKEKCGSIDGLYRSYMEQDSTGWELVHALGGGPSETKMEQIGIPLAAEYLRNVGYDLPKPDRHIRKLLGSERLGLYDRETVPEKEAFHLMIELAKGLKMSAARLDYILWAYYSTNCANKYKQKETRCKCCIFKRLCHEGKKA